MTPWILLGLGAAALAPFSFPARAQASPSPVGPAVVQGDVPGDVPGALPVRVRGTVADWRADLSQPDLEQREARFGEFVERALGDHRLAVLLREWSSSDADPELAWTARLILREVRREQEFARALQGRGRARRPAGPFAGVEERINGVGPTPEGGRPLAPALEAAPPAVKAEERSFRLEMGPSGVRLEVRSLRAGDPPAGAGEGEDEVTVYEADNIGILLEEHPDLAQELGQVRLFSQQGPVRPDVLFRAMRGRADTLGDFWTAQGGSLRTDILGVQMRELDVHELLEDDAVGGLLVERILPGTIAEAVGLRRGDLLLELNGVALGSGDDVSRVLSERQPDAPLMVSLDREGAPLRLTWKPAPPVREE